MNNFSIQFASPWLLLLLIPAVICTLIPYFKASKKYRKTRNRITSIVLHLIVMTLAISLLAGMTVHYTIPNEKNEIILLVDLSDSEERAGAERDQFVETVLRDCSYDGYNVGIVTFGFDQVYAVPLTRDLENAYQLYLDAPKPDTTATNVAAALTYTKSLFTNPATSKIVLITDGMETDEEAKTVIRSVIAQGTKLDAAYIPSAFDGEDMQIVGIKMPDYHFGLNEAVPIEITVRANCDEVATIEFYDNGERDVSISKEIEFKQGDNVVTIDHEFDKEGLHELKAKIVFNGDSLGENDEYLTYINLELFNKILVVQREENASIELINLLNETEAGENEPFVITVETVGSATMPTTIDQLRGYDQVILNNISNKDLEPHVGFTDLLETYVGEYGGGLFTVGGNDENGEANAYKRSDMYGTVYQQMLPVQAINYTPPIGVIVIVDSSGSMSEADNKGVTLLEGAKAGAIACLDAMGDKDYMGLMTLDSTYGVVLQPTPVTQRKVIERAINGIEGPGGGTVFGGALKKAGEELQQIKSYVSKLHVIIVTDGRPGDQPEDYEDIIKSNYDDNGITLSIIGIGVAKNSDIAEQMQAAVDAVGTDDVDKKGRLYLPSDAAQLIMDMKDDLKIPPLHESNDKEYKPVISNMVSPLVYGLERGTGSEINRLNVTLGGFYGVKARASADLILAGDYEVPVYAQWKYGNGMVGSFMCDLQGSNWSDKFMASETGKTFIRRAVNNLMPMQSLRPNELRVSLEEDNYTNRLSIITDLAKGEYVSGSIIKRGAQSDVTISLAEVTATENREGFYVTSALGADSYYSRCHFVVKDAGLYEIILNKFDAEGNVKATVRMYKAFSYSEEYDNYIQSEEFNPKDNVEGWTERSNGAVIEDLEDPWEIFEGFVTDLDRMFDPRFLFMILAIVLFLLDIAVRKFKFKWPHEIIRDYKNKKAGK